MIPDRHLLLSAAKRQGSKNGFAEIQLFHAKELKHRLECAMAKNPSVHLYEKWKRVQTILMVLLLTRS